MGYDALKRMLSWQDTSGDSVQTAYDGEGQQIWQSSVQGGVTTTTVYLTNLMTIATTNGVSTTTTYYSAGVATVVDVNGTLSFVAKDLQGSAAVALSVQGNPTAAHLYTPTGQGRWDATNLSTMPTLYSNANQMAGPQGIDLQPSSGQHVDTYVKQTVTAGPTNVRGPQAPSSRGQAYAPAGYGDNGNGCFSKLCIENSGGSSGNSGQCSGGCSSRDSQFELYKSMTDSYLSQRGISSNNDGMVLNLLSDISNGNGGCGGFLRPECGDQFSWCIGGPQATSHGLVWGCPDHTPIYGDRYTQDQYQNEINALTNEGDYFATSAFFIDGLASLFGIGGASTPSGGNIIKWALKKFFGTVVGDAPDGLLTAMLATGLALALLGTVIGFWGQVLLDWAATLSQHLTPDVNFYYVQWGWSASVYYDYQVNCPVQAPSDVKNVCPFLNGKDN